MLGSAPQDLWQCEHARRAYDLVIRPDGRGFRLAPSHHCQPSQQPTKIMIAIGTSNSWGALAILAAIAAAIGGVAFPIAMLKFAIPAVVLGPLALFVLFGRMFD